MAQPSAYVSVLYVSSENDLALLECCGGYLLLEVVNGMFQHLQSRLTNFFQRGSMRVPVGGAKKKS